MQVARVEEVCPEGHEFGNLAMFIDAEELIFVFSLIVMFLQLFKARFSKDYSSKNITIKEAAQFLDKFCVNDRQKCRELIN